MAFAQRLGEAFLVLTMASPAAADPLTDSLPRRDGEVLVAGLAGPVEITRDEIGVPVVRGETYEDVLRANGFLHAQDRFFQMDLARRLAAGRLSEIAGPLTIGLDRSYRPYRFEAVASRFVAGLSPREASWLRAYAEGVNAGLADLAAPPPEYAFLQATPEPWRSEDSILVMLTMFSTLNFNAGIERRLGVMKEALPETLYRFLTPVETRFDAPLLPEGAGNGYRRLPVPGPDAVDLRGQAVIDDADAGALAMLPALVPGSNNWAVAGARSVHGGAILASDPHLQLTAPGIWYRLQLEWNGERLVGLSLPGFPGIVIGSNGRLAWGMTNTGGDFQDLIIVETDPRDPGRYRTPDGDEAFEERLVEIGVKGGAPRPLTLRVTRWGVVTGADWHGRPLVLKWTALDPAMQSLDLMSMAAARTIEEGVAVARSWHGPSQNVLLASSDGRIAWVFSGYLPRRRGFDGATPVSWADGDAGWDGPLDETLRPVLVDPADGLLYTANNRTVDGAWSRRLGNGWSLGVRAARIAERLREADRMSESDLRAIQLDTRVELFDYYRDLIGAIVRRSTAGGERGERLRAAAAVAAAWDGTSGVDQNALPLLIALRSTLLRRVLQPLVAPCRVLERGFAYSSFRSEEPLRRVLEERPAHLLPPPAATWDEFLETCLADTVDGRLAADVERGLARPWGEDNRASIRHPLAAAAPGLAGMLNLPDDPLPGHFLAVRVATPSFGASARLVVSPGREEGGLLHIPAGQSGNPASPHYRDSHQAWLAGLSTPLLAGEAPSAFVLRPPP